MPKWRHRRLSGKKRALLLVLFLLAALLALAIVAMTHLKPVLTSLATARVSNTVNGIVTAAVNETIYSGGVDYDQLISFEKDNEGKITAVKSNMAEFNRLQSAIIDEVLEKLSEVTTKELSVPVGTLLGSPFLAGRGPLIRVRMQSVGSSSAHFENAFTSAGINQTKHQIYLVVDVYVSILLPGFSTTTKFSNTYSVAETVIVGSVPDKYTYLSNGDEMEQKAEDYIMKNGLLPFSHRTREGTHYGQKYPDRRDRNTAECRLRRLLRRAGGADD